MVYLRNSKLTVWSGEVYEKTGCLLLVQLIQWSPVGSTPSAVDGDDDDLIHSSDIYLSTNMFLAPS